MSGSNRPEAQPKTPPPVARRRHERVVLVSAFVASAVLICLAIPGSTQGAGDPPKAAPKPPAAAPVPPAPPPKTPAESHLLLKTPADLAIDLVLSEPEIAQPLQISFDERGRMWVVEYRQYPFPEGLKVVSRDNFWRSVYDKVPAAPPHHVRGRDRISIHESSRGDGVFDKHKVFVDGLNICTACCPGRGGVWVLHPPYLLFYPDRNRDDVPDGDPEVHLAGFGLEDTHSCANSLQWGPDGWLYACQGSTVTGDIVRPGMDKTPVHTLGQLVWRYHPETKRYEIFAEGGGNAFGLEIDSSGRIFSGHNGGDTRGFHYVQGGYSQKGFNKHGPLSNPYAFGYFPPMKHPPVQRFTHTFLIDEGNALPQAYRGHLFGCEPLQGRIVESRLIPDGSTFRTEDVQHVVTSGDPWFRPVDIKTGPDGAIYIADFYEQQVAHTKTADTSCSSTTGRIYRLRAREASTAKAPLDLGRLPTPDLIGHLSAANKWERRKTLEQLADRRDASAIPLLQKSVASNTGPLALEALWGLNLSGGLDENFALKSLAHENPQVRAWTVRLVCDSRRVSGDLAALLAKLARDEKQIAVRGQLASSARRLPASDSLPIVRALLAHSEDASDPHLPLLIWWALETHCENNRAEVLALFGDAEIWRLPLVEQAITSRLMRRFAQAGTRKDLLTCAQLLALSPDPKTSARLVSGFEEAVQGRPLPSLPGELEQALRKAGGASLALRVRLGDEGAITEALTSVADEKAEPKKRCELLRVLGEAKTTQAVPTLLRIVQSSAHGEVVRSALAALQAHDDPAIAAAVIERFPKLPADAQGAALGLLSFRPASTRLLLEAVSAGRVEKKLVGESVTSAIALQKDETNRKLVRDLWGDQAAASAEKSQQEMARLTAALQAGHGDPYQGKILFMNSCGKCHKLYEQGGQIGPDLTAYQRDDLARMLRSVVTPSAEIREGFEAFVAQTADGRTVTGLVVDQDNQVVVLRTAEGQNVPLARGELETFRALGQSLMPQGLLGGLADQQVRDLFAYLRTTQPLAN